MDNYADLKRIGRGNYGTVALARDVRNGRDYCLKQISMEAFTEDERAQAQQEVEVLRSLDHPGIVRYHEHFMVMALRYVHSKRILHRDLKTQNIFIAHHNGRALIKLGDFGIAKVMEGSMAAASTVIGTPYYMSPEVCQNQPYSFKSDVWALGCILYEMCALQQAWNGSNLLGLVYKIVQQKYPPLPESYSPRLRELVGRMLAKQPEHRPSLDDILATPFVREFLTSQLAQSAPASMLAAPRQPQGRDETAAGGDALGATERFGVPPPRRSSVSSFADRGSSAEQLGSGGYETIAEESCRGSASGDGELTPAERMRRLAEAETGGRRGGHTRPAERRRRKLADADRRHARSSISENREIAKGIRSMQLRSNLDASVALARVCGDACLTCLTFALPQEGPRAKLGSEQAPSRGRTPAPAGLQGWAQRGGGGDGGAGAGSCAGGVGAEDNDEEEEGAYEDDFDEYEATLKHDPAMLQRTQRAAAAARDSNARDAAERQRLLQQAAQAPRRRDSFLVARACPRLLAQSAQLSQDRLALAASRRSSTAGLAERAAAHEYGRGASSEALSALAEEVRRQLTMLVGRERLNDCMWVDQLVFKEIMMR
ncbi:hypothetical protein EMIHUDRAFT_459269 [Emiliania huxleyi CCMP1516]|uniref:non-specific serine/threonine protein kinase n=2 Tax=Emiliania huxleyi TaxID=2903 RepID=A0A0D3IWZ5_EMIH1|nr:hypothetical protein EMIHUDRAFT_459269 [Emiliania huxleyi CCMP1516]EOD15780.1 hypothetical protein EMIHUDRAFT_459269 [Emiliania huxleyi CCMP1516]|eukprot:XP_005768209.1 hypothetical protein EMIHUDRAFT_459269 [Emiliania huxleyi CCMP1516]